jgi:RHS repeat-associated protein
LIPDTGQAYYYHADAEGSVRLITDANAQVVNRYDYDSYGRPLTTIEGVWQPFRWKAREFLGAGVDLYYNRARFYDPQLGRFTSEDPLGYGGGSKNLFVFGTNNPKKWNDPSGLYQAPTPPPSGGTTVGQYAVVAAIAIVAVPVIKKIGEQVNCFYQYINAGIEAANDENVASITSDLANCTVRVSYKKVSEDTPCNPPAGTRCYLPAEYGGHGWLPDVHHHVCLMTYIPSSKKCLWLYPGGSRPQQGGVFAPAQIPSAIKPCSYYGVFGSGPRKGPRCGQP